MNRTFYAFYATVGDNGAVVTPSYDQAWNMQKYLYGHVFIKKFSSYSEASDFAVDHLTDHAPMGCSIPDECELNRVYTIKQLMKEWR